jgi:penicillin-binding protein 2
MSAGESEEEMSMSSTNQEKQRLDGTGSVKTADQQARSALVMVTALLLVALVVSGTYLTFRSPGGANSTLSNCTTSNTPCQVTIAYLVAYTGGQYDDLYALTSNASHLHFTNPLILNHHYKDARDYIIKLTQSTLSEAEIYSISDTIDNAIQTSDTTATVPAHIVMRSARVGTITQKISIPLVKENGDWRIDWSPGLIFSKLNDPVADPYYRRRVVLTPLGGPRGTIYDSQGNVLAEDEIVYQIGIVRDQISNESELESTLSTDLDLTPAEIAGMYADQPADAFVPIRTITPMLYQKIGAAVSSLPGVEVRTTMGRVYPYGEATAAITGYVSPITQAELRADTSHYYDNGDLVGREGIEAWGEQYLRPVKGGTLDIDNVNANGTNGREVYRIASQQAGPGQNIETTISIAEQLATMSALVKSAHGHAGSAIALDPTTGDVLAMASTPTYDPNNFSLGLTPTALAGMNALDHPYLNRATEAAYPIDSVFKPVTLAAAISNGVSPNDSFTCTSTFQVPGEATPRQDINPPCQGSFTLPEALASSSDVIFWEAGVLLNNQDPDILPGVTRAFGYGSKTGIVGLPSAEESPGFVPTPQTVQQQGQTWTPGDAADLAVGQGEFQATPLQVAAVSAALGNGGRRMQPILVSQVISSTGKTVVQFKPRQIGTLSLSANNLAIVQAAMAAATATPGSTSYSEFHAFPVRVAGQTGTAPSGKGSPYAVSAVCAPAPPAAGQTAQPEIAAAVTIEYIGAGQSFAAPVTVAMLQSFFTGA